MALLYRELLEKLTDLDEVTLLEILELYSEDIVNRFEDVIENKQEKIRNYFDEDETNVGS